MLTLPTPTVDSLISINVYYTSTAQDVYVAFDIDTSTSPYMEDSDFADILAIYDARVNELVTEGTTTRHVKFLYASSVTTPTVIS